MTRDRFLFVSLLATGFCLLAALIGFTITPRAAPAAPRLTAVPVTVGPTPTLPLGKQTSLLLLGVESLTSARRRLELVWVLTYLPGTDGYFLVGFAPGLRVRLPGDAAEYSLAEVYADGPPDARGSVWLQQAVQAFWPALSVQGEVDFERRMLVEAIDRLGGLELNGQTLNGTAALAAIDSAAPDSAARLQQQGEVLRALIARDWNTVDVRPVFSLGQKWFPAVDWFLEQARHSRPIGPDEVHITIFPAAT